MYGRESRDEERNDQESIRRDLSLHWSSELPAGAQEESQALLRELVADWAREADSDSDPAAVHAVQRAELEDAGRTVPPEARLPLLRTMVYERLLRRVRVRTYALGCRIIDGAVDRESARAEGRGLLAEAEALSARIRAAGSGVDAARLAQPLSDAVMEALYAVEGKAMSPRLARYAEDQRRGS